MTITAFSPVKWKTLSFHSGYHGLSKGKNSANGFIRQTYDIDGPCAGKLDLDLQWILLIASYSTSGRGFPRKSSVAHCVGLKRNFLGFVETNLLKTSYMRVIIASRITLNLGKSHCLYKLRESNYAFQGTPPSELTKCID